MEIALFIFDKMTPLDAVGPLEVIGRVPGADVKIVGKTAGPVRAGHIGLTADHAMADVMSPDIVLIPGAADMSHIIGDDEILEALEVILGLCRRPGFHDEELELLAVIRVINSEGIGQKRLTEEVLWDETLARLDPALFWEEEQGATNE